MTKQRITIELEFDSDEAVHWTLYGETDQPLRSSRTYGDRLPFASAYQALRAAAIIADVELWRERQDA